MRPGPLPSAAALAGWLIAAAAFAQPSPPDGGTWPAQTPDRPAEDELFGGDETSEQTPAEPAAPQDTGQQAAPAASPAQNAGPPTGEDRDADALDGPRLEDRFESEEAADDPLRIGGQFYFRALASYARAQPFKAVAFSAPTLVDAYFDARPTDRLRAFVSARLTYDPSIDTAANALQGQLIDPEGGVSDAGEGFLTGARPSNPSVLLDQAWLRFDIARRVFLTVGKQHVKWGASRFWNHTDFLSPQRRNPLLVFDPRVGASMVKLHVPWEERGWNFYAIALLEGSGPSDVLGELGGAVRAEVVFWQTELGVDAVAQLGRKPRFGFDLSSALGPFDVYGELALKTGSHTPMFREAAQPNPLLGYAGRWEPYTPEGPTPAASGGLTYTFAYSETDTATVGLEYSYNSLGYQDAEIYPWLILNGAFVPFYLGQQYAAAYVLVAAPGSWDKTSFVGSALANLSDGSFLGRLDVSHRALSYLSIELFAQAHFGTEGGEFRFAIDQPAQTLPGGFVFPAVKVPAPVLAVGGALRVSL